MGMCQTLMALVLALVVNLVAGQQSNRPPVFFEGGDMNGFSIREDTAVGTVVYTLRGSDPEGGRLTYTVSGDHLSVDRISGVVTLIRALDRETLPALEVVITITDQRLSGHEPNTVPLRREIPVVDVNDNSPRFHESPYSFSVLESLPVGATLFSKVRVTDADAGNNGVVVLECVWEQTPKACAKFDVRALPRSGGEFIGVITLKELVDFEAESQFTMVIRATDSGAEKQLSSETMLMVSITDVQDQPPVFLNAPFSATLQEGSAPGHRVMEIRARDGDMGNPLPLFLSIEGDVRGYFALEKETTQDDGTVTALLVTSKVPLDREDSLILESGGLYTFNLRAREDGGDDSIAQVTLVVTDIDDQIPTFSEQQIWLTVSEDIAIGTPLPGLNLVVTDGDVGDNARFSLTLENVVGSEGVFDVFPKTAVGRTPVIVKLAEDAKLDFEAVEKANFVFRVLASQGDIPVSSALVNVTISDANDNAPIFKFPSYRYNVSENVKGGTVIDDITATDADSGQFGMIRYTLKGFGAEKFHVHETTGVIKVADNCGIETTCLDAERQSTYALTYSATDGGSRVTSVDVFIDLVDVNDNAPQFTAREFRRVVEEGADDFDPPLVVQASDSDGPTQGDGKVTYSIVEGNTDDFAFAVNELTGVLSVRRALTYVDTPDGEYNLVLRATDAGAPAKHSDVLVLISVGRDTRKPPRFSSRSFSASIPEDSKPGTSVIEVSVSAADGVTRNDLAYQLTSGARDNFLIDATTGLITVATGTSLDRDVDAEHQLMVIAIETSDESHLTATTTVTVFLTDMNNKPPVFSKDSYVRYVSERMLIGESVMGVSARDPDSDAELVYDLVEPVIARDKTGATLRANSAYDYRRVFGINETSGEIFVAGPLDHNSAAVIILTARVTDHSSHLPEQIDTAEVTLYIQAFSDHSPVFSTPWTPSRPQLDFSVDEELPTGTVIFTLQARDPVSGQQIRRYEKVASSDPLNIFSVAPITGEVTLNSRLDYETAETKEMQLQVLAIAGDKSSEAIVVVNVEDINDNSPQFTENEYHARLSEDAKWPKTVATVKATDGDSGEFGAVTYSLAGDGSQLFVVNQTTGEIRVARGVHLDRESSQIIRLEVTAEDSPKGGVAQRKTTVMVEVELTDVNDASPEWSELGYSSVVPENTPVGTAVVVVVATDPDEGINGLVRYQLPEFQGEVDGLFSIDPESGVLSVHSSLSGKGRMSAYEVKVRAVDQGSPQQYSETTVRVLIGDVSTNDGVPIFRKPTGNDTASVVENANVGTAVYQVEAFDPDDPATPNGRIIYSFLDHGHVGGAFTIDATTGLITTRSVLDRETRSSYTLVVVAQDMGRPPQQASRVLVINVDDVDDNQPFFPRISGDKPLEMNMEEEAAVNTVVGYVIAEDKDKGENAMVDYRIANGNDMALFGINRTADNRGMIYVKDRVDREKVNSVTLTVICSRLGLPSRKASSARDPSSVHVRIVVRDLNDNRPHFMVPQLTTGIKVDSPLQTEVARLVAIDEDPTSPAIRYMLHNITFSYARESVQLLLPLEEINATQVFLLEEATGVLRTNAPLTRYAHGTFSVHVKAFSTSDDEPAVGVITIHVLRNTDLLRFVFMSTPGEVRRQMAAFRHDVQSALSVNASIDTFDTAYYADANGAIDFSRTGSCFQLFGRNMHDTRVLMDSKLNPKLGKVFDKYGVKKVEHCVPRRDSRPVDWVETSVLAVAAFIGAAGVVASVALCRFYATYQRRLRRQNDWHSRLMDTPPPPPSMPPPPGPLLPPGSIVMLPPSMGGGDRPVGNGAAMSTPPGGLLNGEPRAYEWQERGIPLDAISYRSGGQW